MATVDLHLPRFMTVKQVADALQVSPAHIYRVINDGEMRSVRIKRSIRVTDKQLNEYIEAQSK